MEVKTKSTALNLETLAEAASQARGLAIDAIKAAGIGHLGLPLGATEIGAILFGHALNFNPENPRWLNRDRFVLSAGHGSMFLYAWLHLSGFNIPMEEIRNFRQLNSMTPGHPEFGDTPGVECTTGPLGQGIGNAVGMAIAAKMAGAVGTRPGSPTPLAPYGPLGSGSSTRMTSISGMSPTVGIR